MKLRKIRDCLIRNFQLCTKKIGFLSINILDRWNYICLWFCLIIHSFWSISYSISSMMWEKTSYKKFVLELIKRRSKVHAKNTSHESGLVFYQLITVWLWFIYRITKSKCRSLLFADFIQTQKRYPTSLDKRSNLTWRLLVI